MRFLAVGDAPPFTFKIVNGVRQEQEAPKGSLPPREVVIPVRQGKKEGQDTLGLRLGTIGAPKLVSAGDVVIRGKNAGEEARPWASLKMPESSAALSVVFRDPRQKTWDAVLSITMADDLRAFPLGAVRFANATPFAASVVFQGKKSDLKPGQVLVVPGKTGGVFQEEQLAVGVLDSKGRLKRIFDSAISQGRGERTNVVIHWSDGERPRRPAKVLIQRERPALRALPKE